MEICLSKSRLKKLIHINSKSLDENANRLRAYQKITTIEVEKTVDLRGTIEAQKNMRIYSEVSGKSIYINSLRKTYIY